VSDIVKMACDSKGAGHGIFAAADANGDYAIGAQHVLNFRSERDRMRLAAVIDKRRLHRRNLCERNDRAHFCYLIQVLVGCCLLLERSGEAGICRQEERQLRSKPSYRLVEVADRMVGGLVGVTGQVIYYARA
jgi:hypothetical protein